MNFSKLNSGVLYFSIRWYQKKRVKRTKAGRWRLHHPPLPPPLQKRELQRLRFGGDTYHLPPSILSCSPASANQKQPDQYLPRWDGFLIFGLDREFFYSNFPNYRSRVITNSPSPYLRYPTEAHTSKDFAHDVPVCSFFLTVNVLVFKKKKEKRKERDDKNSTEKRNRCSWDHSKTSYILRRNKLWCRMPLFL